MQIAIMGHPTNPNIDTYYLYTPYFMLCVIYYKLYVFVYIIVRFIYCNIAIYLHIYYMVIISGGFMGDIALPNINYESQWQSQKLNKSFQQELERMKQEVYHEGLQVEEEGLTDIIRKKTKLPNHDKDDENLNERNKNDPALLVRIIHKKKHKNICMYYVCVMRYVFILNK